MALLQVNRYRELQANGQKVTLAIHSVERIAKELNVPAEEVYLNAIEAHLRSDDPTGGGDKTKGYYNTLRQKRGLTATTTAISFEELTKERSRELLGEGFRYWDLLRWSYYEKDNHTKTIIIPQYNKTGVADAANNKTVPNRLFAFPIPQAERNSEYSNVPQNDGY